MLKNCLLATTALVTALAVAAPAHADSGNLSLADRVRILEQELSKSKEYQQDMRTRLTTLESNANAVQWSFDNGRPKIKSGDGRFELAFRGRFHLDYANFDQEEGRNGLRSGAVVRRAQFGVEGKAFTDFWYEMRFNFGDSSSETGSVPINIMRVAYMGIDNFRINVGVMQPIFTMSDAVSSNEVTFIERAEVINAMTDNFGGSDERRGVEMTFQKEDSFYPGDNLLITGAYTGNKTGTTRTDDERQHLLGRVAYRLWSDGTSNIQVGGSGAKIISMEDSGSGNGIANLQFRDRPEMRVDGTRLVDTGGIPAQGGHMYGFEAAANWKSLYIGGEYYKFAATDVVPNATRTGADAEFEGWYVEASYFLTGESKKYAASSKSNNPGVFGAPKIIKPFAPAAGSWGAVELAIRYSLLDLNDSNAGIAGGVEKGMGAGVNWYLNNNIRVMVNYLKIDAGDQGAGGFQTGVAAAQRNQQVDIYGARVQFAF